jgi:hypothetical protein
MELIVLGYGFFATFIGTAIITMGMLYTTVPSLREAIIEELKR